MAIVRRLLRAALIAGLAIVVFAAGWLAGRLGIGSVVEPASLTEAERQFSERIRNVNMIGTFTVWGREERTPRTDRYQIASVEKGKGPLALQRADGLLWPERRHRPDRGADALGRGYTRHHDDQHGIAGHRHLQRPRVLLRATTTRGPGRVNAREDSCRAGSRSRVEQTRRAGSLGPGPGLRMCPFVAAPRESAGHAFPSVRDPSPSRRQRGIFEE